MFSSLPAVTATCLFFGQALAQSVDPIVIKGSKFFYKTNGTQFYLRGIAYQQDFSANSDVSAASGSDSYTDPLADASTCARDIPYLKQLRTNTIRVYAVDPTQDHTQCMTMLANAGIYVIADLGAPETSINSNDPSWNTELYARYTSVVDNLAQYDNVLGFFAGNEVVSQPNQTIAAPFVKAAVRDTKAYIKSKNYRAIGVGYATSDNQYIREQLADYMNCGSDQANAVDFWGYNVYSWCGSDATFQSSGYDTRVQEFESYSVPVFFAEYGCNQPSPRVFDETPVLYGPMMDGVFSGGIVYLYFQEANDYGLVQVEGDTVSTLADFTNLASKIATVSPSQVQSGSYNPTNAPQACPTQQTNWTAVTALPPTPNTQLCNCMYDSLSCVVSPDASSDSYGDLFSYVCGQNAALCDGIAANGSTGAYGSYGMCSDKQQLGYVLDQYYSSRGSDPTACSFSGSAVTTAAASATGSCASQLAVASSSAGAAGSAASSSKGVAGFAVVAGYDLSMVSVGLLVNLAVFSGVGMILL